MDSAALVSFDLAVRAFTETKTGEGVGVISQWELEERGECSLRAALRGSLAAMPPLATTPQRYNALLYFMLRRWLTSVSGVYNGEGGGGGG